MLSTRAARLVVQRHASSSRCFLFRHTQKCSFGTSVSLDTLKQLRSQSGAPMVECKKALEESDNNLSQAMDWLRQHGVAKASSKSSGRDASEGLVGLQISSDGQTAALVKVSSETDFASRSDAFTSLITHVADASLSSNKDGSLDENDLLQLTSDSKTVQQALDDAILAIRENMSLSRAVKLSCKEGRLVGYVHGKMEGSSVAGTAAALVHVQGADASPETLQDVGKKLAMHVVAAKPLYLSPDSVPEAAIEKEKTVLKQQMAESGKPDDIVEKIVNGRMRKFYEGVCLTEQAHMVEEGNPKVSKVLKDLGIEVTQFQSMSIS